MKVLVTGAAGFIGYHYSKFLLEQGYDVIGIDNLNNYYNVQLKKDRLKKLTSFKTFDFVKGDISNLQVLEDIFRKNIFEYVVNLAAQAGVRYSIENPHAYIESNIVGFINILECCRHNNIRFFYIFFVIL